MPLASGQKGTGKKNAGSIARQRSRNTTPSSIPPTASLPPIETVETEYLDLKFELFRNITYEDIMDSAAASAIPDSRSLDGTLTRLQRLLETVEQRGTYYDRGMRLLAQNRKTRMDEMAAERGREEERLRREADDEERERRANKKKRKAPDHPSAPSGKTGESPLLLLRAFEHLSLLFRDYCFCTCVVIQETVVAAFWKYPKTLATLGQSETDAKVYQTVHHPHGTQAENRVVVNGGDPHANMNLQAHHFHQLDPPTRWMSTAKTKAKTSPTLIHLRTMAAHPRDPCPKIRHSEKTPQHFPTQPFTT